MVKFPFSIGKAFLDYNWHPITIPKTHYKNLEQERLAEGFVAIASTFGSMSGSIIHSRAGYGPDGHFKIPHLWPGQNPPGDSRKINY
jgi:hypothetical protein